MKKVIVGITKVIPWINLIAGCVVVIANPPRSSWGDENAPLAIAMLIGVVLMSACLLAFSYVVEASCLYLEKNSEVTKDTPKDTHKPTKINGKRKVDDTPKDIAEHQ